MTPLQYKLPHHLSHNSYPFKNQVSQDTQPFSPPPQWQSSRAPPAQSHKHSFSDPVNLTPHFPDRSVSPSSLAPLPTRKSSRPASAADESSGDDRDPTRMGNPHGSLKPLNAGKDSGCTRVPDLNHLKETPL